MKSILVKEIKVKRNKHCKNFFAPDYSYIGIDSRITIIKLLGIPIYKKEELFGY